MTTIARLKVLMEADSRGLNKALGGVRKGVGHVSNAMGELAQVGARVAGITAGIGASLAALAGAGIAKTIADISKLSKTARKLGIDANAFLTFNDAAKEAGIGTSTLEMGFQRAGRRIAEAANGTGEAVKALKTLGLDARRLNMMPFHKQMVLVGDALQGVTNEQQRNALAMKLFDSEGVALVNLFQTLADAGGKKGVAGGFKSMRDELDRTGRAIDERSKFAENVPDRFKRMFDVIRGAFNQLTLTLLPGLDFMVGRLEAFTARGDFLRLVSDGARNLGKFLGEAGIQAGKFLARKETWKEFGQAIKDVRDWFSDVAKSIGSFVAGIKAAYNWVQRMVTLVEQLFANIGRQIDTLKEFFSTVGKVAELSGSHLAKTASSNIARASAATGTEFERGKAAGQAMQNILREFYSMITGKSAPGKAAGDVLGAAATRLQDKVAFNEAELKRIENAISSGVVQGFRGVVEFQN